MRTELIDLYRKLANDEPVSTGEMEAANELFVRDAMATSANMILGNFDDLEQIPELVRLKHGDIRVAVTTLCGVIEGFYREVGQYNSDGTLRPEPTEEPQITRYGPEEPVTASEVVAAEADPAIPTDSPRCNCRELTAEDLKTRECFIHPRSINADYDPTTDPNAKPAQATLNEMQNPCSDTDPDNIKPNSPSD